MRDYSNLITALRINEDLFNQRDAVGIATLYRDAADAIEELQNQIAEYGKMVDELITYAQKNADESREAEQRHYGSDSTVNVYTWMHNVKCVHERYVAKLDDIAAKLPAPPKGATL